MIKYFVLQSLLCMQALVWASKKDKSRPNRQVYTYYVPSFVYDYLNRGSAFVKGWFSRKDGYSRNSKWASSSREVSSSLKDESSSYTDSSSWEELWQPKKNTNRTNQRTKTPPVPTQRPHQKIDKSTKISGIDKEKKAKEEKKNLASESKIIIIDSDSDEQETKKPTSKGATSRANQGKKPIRKEEPIIIEDDDEQTSPGQKPSQQITLADKFSKISPNSIGERKWTSWLLNELSQYQEHDTLNLPLNLYHASRKCLSVQDMRVLLQVNEWLNDDIINTYLAQLYSVAVLKNPKIKILNSLWIQKTNIAPNFRFSPDTKYLWPINSGNNHWTLLVIEWAKKKYLRLYHYDSLSFDIFKLDGLPKALEFLKQHGVDDYLSVRSIKSYSAPQQTNGIDCGLFTLYMAEQILFNKPINHRYVLKTFKFRARVAWDLLTGKISEFE